jgi:hypothetical protein
MRSPSSIDRLRRLPGTRQERKLFYIFTEDAKSSADYLRRISFDLQIAAEVEIAAVGMEPINVVDRALDRRKSLQRQGLLRDSALWCVFDRERRGQRPDLPNQIARAKAKGINVALSVPCFEYWLYLHFKLSRRPNDCCADMIKDLKKYIASYEKCELPLDVLLPLVGTACRNSELLRADRNGDLFSCPSTDLDKLITSMARIARKENRAPLGIE